MKYRKLPGFVALAVVSLVFRPELISANISGDSSPRPNIVLIMTDDQGWGQTGYYNHPVLKTPNLDAMAANGLRLDRFYAGGPVCSPTRATVLTGRSHNRTGVPSHGHALRLQEKTLAVALKAAGYATGHFGKWHLNALRGPGIPILKDDPRGPAMFGFEEWISVTNFFDLDPLMSRRGDFEQFSGDSSAIIVGQALEFMAASVRREIPFLAVIWDGSPHSPWRALKEDRKAFADLDEKSQHHYGELVAFDRSVGQLREGLRQLGVADNTLVWFCSDNGGLPKMNPDTVGGLRGYKGSLWEGGVRVPCVIEWPAGIVPKVSNYPASTMDIFPTIADLLDLPESVLLEPVDGRSIRSLFREDPGPRKQPIPFRSKVNGAWIDNDLKLVADLRKGTFQLFNLKNDPSESEDISGQVPAVFERMKAAFLAWDRSVQASVNGEDYPEGRVREDEPQSHFWRDDPRYEPYFEDWKNRPEYSGQLKDWNKKNP